MKRKSLLFGLMTLSLLLTGCCLIMPKYRTSTITINASPSTAQISLANSGKLIGTGTATVSFDCKDDKGDYYAITIQADDYHPKTIKIYNQRYNYTENVTLQKIKHTKVQVITEPSDAEIYYKKSGNLAGTGSCSLDFSENDASSTYYELVIKAPYYYDKTVNVYKGDGTKQISLMRKPIKTIVTIPEDADISINNEVVARGNYDIDFESRDKVLVTLSRIGYETEIFALLKSNPQQTITYELEKDEAYENSEGGESASQYANKWVPIKIRKGLSEDEAWLRMISIVREHFEQIEKTDKTSGWIKTFPVITPYKKSDVRTTLEIVPSYSTGEKVYKVRLSFEKRKKNSGDDGWSTYERLMKQYKDVIPNLLNSVGGM
ncbi:MAG: hypothetical protein MJ002_08285 [Paludibacteraceae bacterium]|nr:hypothetical protein [Paludibacteraceae bacterium]